ncbi:MAG TPA: PDZ domain-containing protein, partial [Saprospiraceae bacterium]|nr:PDZ domain-containing protein [Saprospiraceae bacterium]
KVSLGVMPDYVYDGEGMRVDGVTDGKPAQAAGVQKGDIIIGIGDVQVKTIQDYMGGLSKFNTGDATVLKINRNGQVLELSVKF